MLSVETVEKDWESLDETLASIVEPPPIAEATSVTVYRLIRYVGPASVVQTSLDLSLIGEHDDVGGLKIAGMILADGPSVDQIVKMNGVSAQPTTWRARKIEPPAPAAPPREQVNPLRLWVEVGNDEEERLPLDDATLLVQALSHYADSFDNAHALRLAERISLGHLPQGDQ